MKVRCQCKNENEIIIVYDYHLKEWCCKDCKCIIKSDWVPKDLFKCYCNYYEQKDSVFDYECQSKEWKCGDCQYHIKFEYYEHIFYLLYFILLMRIKSRS
jgi:hypothetical protein